MRRRSFCALWVRALCAALATATAAHAQVVSTFTNPLGGVWADAGNWDSADFPDNDTLTYTARLLALSGAYTVDLDIDVTLDAFVLDSAEPTLDLQTFSLDVLNDFSMNLGLLRSAGLGTVVSRGTTSFTGVTIEGLGSFTTEGNLEFLGSLCNDLCDTPLLHTGSSVNWAGTGDIRLGEGASFAHGPGSTFTIASDARLFSDSAGAAPLFMNDGVLIKQGSAGTTFFEDVDFINTGTLQIESGVFRTNGVDLASNANTLDTGVWNVLNGSALELVDGGGAPQQIQTNRANITLSGAGAQFDALGFIQLNDTGGELLVDHDTTFTTQGDFENQGRLSVGAATVFEIPLGSSLINESAGALTDGVFDLRGALRLDTAGIDTINTALTLDGASAQIQNSAAMDAIAGIALIDTAGELVLLNGRDLTTNTDLTNDGSLTVGSGTELRVLPGNILTNFAGGVFSGGTFELQGQLVFDNADVREIDNRLTLDGPGERILTQDGMNGLSALDRITPNGRLTLRNGHDLLIGENLVVEGELIIENGPPASPLLGSEPTRLVVTENLSQIDGSVLVDRALLRVDGVYTITGGTLTAEGLLETHILNSGGVVEVGGSLGAVLGIQNGSLTLDSDDAQLAMRVDFRAGVNDVLEIAGALTLLGPGSDTAGVLRIDTDGARFGDVADVIFFDTHAGGFTSIVHPPLGGTKFIEAEYLDDRVRLHVVPTPGSALVLLGLGLLPTARRRV